MKYRGHVEGGLVVLDLPIRLPEGTVVEITPVEIPLDSQGKPVHPAFLIGDLAIDMDISDLASKYGGPTHDPGGGRTGEDEDNPLLKMLDLAVDTGIPDLATNIDHYLYGHPKVDDGR